MTEGKKKWFLTIGLAGVPLLGFWLYGLFDLDEGYYAAVVAEMNRRHEWITPYFNGKPWFEKPILLYWFAKPSVLLFGEMVGPRLPSVLATVVLFGICGLFLRRHVSGTAGRWAAAMLGTSILIIGMGRMMTTDALLDLAICGAFLSFYDSLVGDRKWRLLTAFCLGAAVLAKGPVSLPLFIALAAWTYIAEPELRAAFKGWWLLGTAILFATVCVWYVPAYLENGQVFVQKFFIEQNLQRFSGGDEAHKVPLILSPIYYPVILAVGLLPWTFDDAKAWFSSFKGESTPLQRFLGRWALIILIFFTISGTKLPHYILPAMPPLIMLGAIYRAQMKSVSFKVVAAWAVSMCVLANAVFMLYFNIGGFAELDANAHFVNESGASHVITYELARVANAGGLAMNDTSNPSLGFYLDQTRVRFQDTANIFELLQALQPLHGQRVALLTRPGRLTPDDEIQLLKQGWKKEKEPEFRPNAKYRLYFLTSPKG